MLSTIQKNLSKMAKATSFPLLQQLKPDKISIFRLDFNIEEKTRKRLSAFIAGTMLFSYLSIAPVEVLASGYDPYSFSSEDTSDRGITSEPNSLKEKRLNEESLQRAKALADQEAKRKAQEQAQSKAGNNNSQSDMEQKRQEAKLRASGAYSTLPNQQQNNTTASPNQNTNDAEDANNKNDKSQPGAQKYADDETSENKKVNKERVNMIINKGQSTEARIEPRDLSVNELRLFDSIKEDDAQDAFTICYNHVKGTFTDEQAIFICKDSKNLVNFTYCKISHKDTPIEETNCFDTINVNVLKEQKNGEEQEEKSFLKATCDKIRFKPTESVNENDTITYTAARVAEAVFGFNDCVDFGITAATTILAFTGVGALAGAGKLIAGTGKISQMLTKLGIKAFPKADVLAIEGAETEEKLGRAKAVLERAKNAGKKDADELLNKTGKMEQSIEKETEQISKLEDKLENTKHNLENTKRNLERAESSLEEETNKMWDAYEAGNSKVYGKAKKAFDEAYDKKYNLEDSLKRTTEKLDKTTEKLDKTTDKLSANKAEAEKFLEENRGKLKEYVVEETIRDSTTAKVFSATSSKAGKTIMLGTDIVAKGMHDYNEAISKVQGDPKVSSYYSSSTQGEIINTSDTQKQIETLTGKRNDINNKISTGQISGFNDMNKAGKDVNTINNQIQALQNSQDVKNQQYLEQVATRNKENAQKGFMTTKKNQNDQ